MNGAAEAILEELLRQANITNVHLAAMLKQGASVSSGAGSGVASFSKSLGPASIALGAVAAAGSLVSGALNTIGSVFGALAKTVVNIGSNLYTFGEATALGTAKLSDFYAAFKDIPLLGTAFGVFTDVIRYQEKILDSYQKMAFAGASFAGDLDMLRSAAGRSYVSMDEFAGIVSDNADLFAQIGVTVDGGIKRFVNLQERLVGPNSEYGNMMAGLGFTAKSTADMLTSYMRSQGTTNKEKLASDDVVIKGTIEYAKHLNELSQLTGQNTEQLKKQAEEIQAEEAFQAYLAMLSPEKADAINAAIRERTATGGKEAGLSLRNAVMGLNVPMSEAQVAFEAATNGALTMSNAQVIAAINAGKSREEISKIERENMFRAGKQFQDLYTVLGPATAAMIKDPLITAGAAASKFAREMDNDAKLDASVREARKNQAKAEASRATELENAQRGIRRFGETMMTVVWGIIQPMTPVLTNLATAIKDAFIGVSEIIKGLTESQGFKDNMRELGDWIKRTVKSFSDAYKEGGFSGLLRKLGSTMLEGFVGIWEAFKPVFTNIVAPTINALFSDLMVKLGNSISAVLGIGTVGKYLQAKSNVEELESILASGKFGPGQTESSVKLSLEANKHIMEQQKTMAERELARQESASEFRWRKIKENTESYFNPQSATPVAQSANVRRIDNAIAARQQAEEAQVTQNLPQVQLGQSGNVNTVLITHFESLNNQVSTLITLNRELIEQSRNNVSATRSLNGNLYAQ